MPAAFSILVVSEDESEALKLRSALPRRFDFSSPLLGRVEIPLEVQTLVLSQSWEVSFAEQQFDLGIFSLHQETAPVIMANSGLIQDSLPSVIFLSDQPRLPFERWRSQSRNVDVLVRPFSEHTLRLSVEERVMAARLVYHDSLNEEQLTGFVRSLIQRGIDRIEPLIDPQRRKGYRYPTVLQTLGPVIDDVGLLDYLAEIGLLRAQVAHRLRRCTFCASPRLSYRETCPECHSCDFANERMVYCRLCQHVDDVPAFTRGGELVCPACRRPLDKRGRDYDRLDEAMRCRSCTLAFAEPEVQAVCLHCGSSESPDETQEELVYGFEILPQAEEVALSGQILAGDFETMLRSRHTGLYARQFFEFELKRELARHKRYDTPASLLMIRLGNLAKLRERHPTEALDWASNVYQALAAQMRTLDLSCVWSAKLLALLLPATPEEGAEVVRGRLLEQVAEMDFPNASEAPQISIAVIGCSKDFADEQQMIATALERLG